MNRSQLLVPPVDSQFHWFYQSVFGVYFGSRLQFYFWFCVLLLRAIKIKPFFNFCINMSVANTWERGFVYIFTEYLLLAHSNPHNFSQCFSSASFYSFLCLQAIDISILIDYAQLSCSASVLTCSSAMVLTCSYGSVPHHLSFPWEHNRPFLAHSNPHKRT